MFYLLGGGFKHFLFASLLGEMIQFNSYFSNGLEPPTSLRLTDVFFCEGDFFGNTGKLKVGEIS